MKKQILTIALGAVVMLGGATTLSAQNGLPTGGYPSVAGGAAGNPGFAPGPIHFQTPSGRTLQLRTAKVGGQTMIFVPMYMACDVFHVYC